MSLSGVVKKWVADKGFGFIQPEDGSADVFVHFRQIQGGKRALNEGEKVTYSMGTNPKTGRPVAENVVGDGSGTPAQGSGHDGYRNRGGFAGRGGSRGYSHEVGVGHAGQMGGISNESRQTGYSGVGAARVSSQTRFSPYRGQNGRYSQPQRGSPSQHGSYQQQGARGYQQQVVDGSGGQGQRGYSQYSASSYRNSSTSTRQQKRQPNNNYRQQDAGTYPQEASSACGRRYEQGTRGNSFPNQPAVSVRNYDQQQRSGERYAHDVTRAGNNPGDSFSQY